MKWFVQPYKLVDKEYSWKCSSKSKFYYFINKKS